MQLYMNSGLTPSKNVKYLNYLSLWYQHIVLNNFEKLPPLTNFLFGMELPCNVTSVFSQLCTRPLTNNRFKYMLHVQGPGICLKFNIDFNLTLCNQSFINTIWKNDFKCLTSGCIPQTLWFIVSQIECTVQMQQCHLHCIFFKINLTFCLWQSKCDINLKN